MTAAPTSPLIPSGKARPCPICRRTKDDDCRISEAGDRLLCWRGTSHHPPEGMRRGKSVVPGSDGKNWAYTGDSECGRWAVFTLDKPRTGTTARKVVPARHLGVAPDRPAPPTAGAERFWRYTPDFIVCRFPDPVRGKAIRPLWWTGGKWQWKSPPKPRPLYWARRLASAPVVIAEGEPATDAAAQLFPDHAAVTWPGGCPGVDKADWQPLRGREVVIWPDADGPGRKAAATLAGLLLAIDCRVTVVAVPDDLPQGWDLANGLAEGWDAARAADAVTRYGRAVERPEAPSAPPETPAAAEPAPAAEPLPSAPFRILGWNQKRDAVWIQSGGVGQIAQVPTTQTGLQRMAPLAYWETLYPSKTGVGWAAAVSSICEQAEAAGVFQPDKLRGQGVWLERGRVVWNLGDRVEVDGVLMPLVAFRDTGYAYGCYPALEIDPEVQPLTDAEGRAILDLLHRRMTWDESDHDGLYLAGQIVLGNVGGALEQRPGLQVTGHTQAGKSTVLRKVIRPLQAQLGLHTSGSTEAGIRQALQAHSLPVLIDESEQELAAQREGHLRLLRLSFDGQTQMKGSQGGQAVRYSMRSSITLSGINAAIPNAADRNRLVVIKPRKMAAASWQQFQQDRDQIVTVEAGARLIRRTVTGLQTLMANIRTMTAVISGMGTEDRSAEVYGALLAGAHHLTSTAVLDPQSALLWLDAVGWSGLSQAAADAVAADHEGRACLEHLLSFAVPWKPANTGSTDIRGLLAIVRHSSEAEASKALGRLGIKLDREHGIVVSHGCSVFVRSKWAHGAHSDRLLQLDGAASLNSPVRFPGGPNRRGVTLPLRLADLDG